MITILKTKKLFPHPNNPRKDVGDVTELAESIKVRGVLQNLTVVPKGKSKTEYYVVIGNRRQAAALAAGLDELPCVISDMDEKTQVETMLLENIQRTDLTAYEQAQGFQMMLDFGESVESVSERTGFSKSTIRRRVNLLELDQKKFIKAEERGASLFDYAKLDDIEDIKVKNQVLETIGTSNFDYTLKIAIEKQEKEKKQELWRALLSPHAEEIEEFNWSNHSSIKEWNYNHDPEIAELPDDINVNDKKLYFAISKWSIKLCTDKVITAQTVDPEEAERRARKAEQIAGLEAAEKMAFELRKEFVLGVSNAAAKKKIRDIVQYLVVSDVNFRAGDLAEIMGVVESGDEEHDDAECIEGVLKAVAEQPERSLLLIAYVAGGDDETKNWRGRWSEKCKGNDWLDNLYTLLEVFGYELSDEEKALQDGTFALYTPLDVCKNCGRNENEYARSIGKDNEKCSECAEPCDLCHDSRKWKTDCRDKCCDSCENGCNAEQKCRIKAQEGDKQ